jgi:Tfp pilus assembly protein PilX
MRKEGIHLRTDERGIALTLALLVLIVLSIVVASAVSFAAANTRGASLDVERVSGRGYAEAGMQAVFGVIAKQNTSGGNPSAANLLGCSGATGPADTAGPSNCASPSPKWFCVTSASCTPGEAGTASTYGFFSGTSAASFAGVNVPPSTWLLVSTGYAPNPNTNVLTPTTTKALVKVSSLGAGAVASVWNHLFVTSPLVTNACALSFDGNGVTVTVPLYVIGNVCLGSGGAGVVVSETTQPVDVQIGGKLVLLGGSKIGADSTHPITSGVVVGGCTTTGVTAATNPCETGFSYWVRNPDSFVANDAPSQTQAQIAQDYATFDPGPKNLCATGGANRLADSAFDNDLALNLANEPNTSGAAFDLTPAASYSCVSRAGSSVGQLNWDATTKRLTINGSIFFDGNLVVSQSATYTGTAIIEVAGTVTFNGNGTALCATGPPCNTSLSAWQGSSGNNSMLTLASVKQNATAITFTNNAQTFQGSFWTQPSSSMTFVKNGVTVEGPMSIGSFDANFNNATFIPLPAIKNMPVGAPVPPNTAASIEPPLFVS